MTKAIKNISCSDSVCYYILYYLGDKKYSTMFYAKNEKKAVECLQKQFPFPVEIVDIFAV